MKMKYFLQKILSPLRGPARLTGGDKRGAFLWALLLVLTLYSCSTTEKNELKVVDPECEYLIDPLGIDAARPLLSWKLEASGNGVMQKAYRVLVASDEEKLKNNIGDLWDSDTVRSGQSLQVEYAGKDLQSRQKVYWKVMVWDNRGNVSDWSKVSTWETAFLQPSDWKAKWIGDRDGEKIRLGQKNPAIYLRKTFEVKSIPEKARVYISGIGYYELYINGKKVGDHVLSPNQTNYDRRVGGEVYNVDLQNFKTRILYETFDITDLLQEGRNAAVVILGNGWYLRTEREEYLPMSYDYPRMIAQFEIDLSRGSEQVVVSDDTWKMTTEGPIRDNSITNGEIYDARLDDEAWYKPGFDDSSWQSTKLVRVPDGKLHAQMSPPDRVTSLIHPVSVKEVRKGVYRYDFGTMFAGWIKFKIKGKKGEKLKMVYFEDNGNNYDQRDTYIFKSDGVELWEPRFTWHAFRYVEIAGSSEPLTLNNVIGKVVHTDVKHTGEFECSNDLFNTISGDFVKTQFDNMHGGVPSDCPHRERRGYTGDGQIAAQAAIYDFDMRAFYTKWLNDIADAQDTQTGYVPYTAPYMSGGGGTAWGSAYIIIPWYMYLYYGDAAVFKKHYEGMKRYIGYLKDHTDENHLFFLGKGGMSDLGEWVPPAPTEIPADFVSSAYFFYDLILMSKMAVVMGKEDEEKAFNEMARRLKSAFNKKYLDTEKMSYSIGRQGANVFPLAFGMVPKEYETKVFNTLVNHIEKDTKGHFDTGMMGTPYLLEVLTKYGRADLAYTVMNQHDFPSYGYNIELGATTLWETWDGKASHSHPMFGSVCAWFYQGLAGINPDPSMPGFKHVVIKPSVVDELDSVNAKYASVYGDIRCEWRVSGRDLKMDIEIPANTTATVYVPASNAANVEVSDKMAVKNGFKDGYAEYKVPSGKYSFISKNIKGILRPVMAVAPAIKPLDTTLFIPGVVTVNIRQFNKNSVIRYTLDGSEPDENSTIYETPFKVTKSTVIKAKVFKKGQDPSVTVKRNIVFVDKERNGVAYKFYEGTWRKLPSLSRMKPERTGKTYRVSIEEMANLPDNFALVMTSELDIREAGSYTFELFSNDGSHMYIDGKLLINNDGLHGFKGRSGKVKLTKGMHKIKVEYFQAGGGRGLELFYEGPGIERQKVPADVLYVSPTPALP